MSTKPYHVPTLASFGTLRRAQGTKFANSSSLLSLITSMFLRLLASELFEAKLLIQQNDLLGRTNN